MVKRWQWNEGNSLELTDDEGQTVLDIYESHGGGMWPSAEVRALIEAAPELRDALAALVAATARVEDEDFEGIDGAVSAENAARALLARLGVTL